MKKHWKIISANITALFVGVYVALNGFNLPGGGSLKSNEIEGFFWPNQKQLSEFSMIDHHGNEFNLSRLEENWNLLFFGYTYCPDICPITMSILQQVNGMILQDALPEHRNQIITFVSVDGERDNPDHLANYIKFYDQSFVAASGTPSQVDSLAGQLGVPYKIEPHEPGDKNYLVSHSGAIFLISPEGKLVSIFQPPYEAAGIAKRYQTIRLFIDQQS